MDKGELIQLLASAGAVGVLIALAGWLGRPRALPRMDEDEARRVFALEFPGETLTSVWLAEDGRGAIARSGGEALIAFASGDGYVARKAPWAAAEGAKVKGKTVRIALGEVGAPAARLVMAVWPPRSGTA